LIPSSQLTLETSWKPYQNLNISPVEPHNSSKVNYLLKTTVNPVTSPSTSPIRPNQKLHTTSILSNASTTLSYDQPTQLQNKPPIKQPSRSQPIRNDPSTPPDHHSPLSPPYQQMIDLTSGTSPPLFILPPIPYQFTLNSFNPPSLPYHLSNHRLLTSTVLETLTPLTTYCQLPATTPFARSSQDLSILFTIRHLRDLLSHNAFTDDEVMCLFTDLLYQSCPGVTYTKMYFSHFLTTVGWQRAKAFLSPHITSSRRTYNHPSISGESVILIPFFVNTNHWVAISRHERQGSVTFLYADDLNSPSTETRIKRLLSNTSSAFYPQNANWMNCYNTTYTPHAN